jgi:hypothetical protein
MYLFTYPSAIKFEIMLLSGKWMELDITMLSKISQTQKDKYVFSHKDNLDLKKKKDMNMKRRLLGKRK